MSCHPELLTVEVEIELPADLEYNWKLTIFLKNPSTKWIDFSKQII